jgi:hypothetical protein
MDGKIEEVVLYITLLVGFIVVLLDVLVWRV